MHNNFMIKVKAKDGSFYIIDADELQVDVYQKTKAGLDRTLEIEAEVRDNQLLLIASVPEDVSEDTTVNTYHESRTIHVFTNKA